MEPAGNREVKRLQQRARKHIEVELRETPGPSNGEELVGFLHLEHGVLHRAVVAERQGHRLVEGEERGFELRRGCG